MNTMCEDPCHPLNVKLLAKREETEKLILNEHFKIKSLFLEKQKIHTKMTSIVEGLHQESNALINQSAILSGEKTHLKNSIMQFQNLVQEILCKIDGIQPKQMLASMVQEKEQKTLQLFYDQMKHQKQELTEFWKKELDNSEIIELNNKKIKLMEREEELQNQVNWYEEKCSELKIMKLTEESMILRKRNAALLKRKTRILEQLERKIKDKREEIDRAKRNMTFKPS